MDTIRRDLLKAGGALAVAGAFGVGFFRSGQALAARSQAAFQAKSATDAMRALGMQDAQESKDIVIRAPDIAENGAVVPIEVSSNVPGTKSIALVIEKNPFPLATRFDFAEGAVPYVKVNVKMGESSFVRAYAEAGGKHYSASREIKVTIGGCGG